MAGRARRMLGGGENFKMFFWPNKIFLGEEFDLLFLENKNVLHLQHEEVRVDK